MTPKNQALLNALMMRDGKGGLHYYPTTDERDSIWHSMFDNS
jgi:hypothetical protein